MNREPEATPSAPSPVNAVVWDWRAARDPGTQRRERARRAAAARREGLLRAVVGVVAAGLLLLWKPILALVVAAITALLLALALASPLGGYRRVSIAVERFAYAVALTVTWVLMTLLYYLVVLPMGLVLRATGGLRLRRRPDPRQQSYWSPVDQPAAELPPYRRQF